MTDTKHTPYVWASTLDDVGNKVYTFLSNSKAETVLTFSAEEYAGECWGWLVVDEYHAELFRAAPETAAERDRLKELNAEMLGALRDQHEAIDSLFAMLVNSRAGFYPTQSGQPWGACVRGKAVIDKAEAGQ